MIKKMFATPKKTVISVICLLALAALLCTGTVLAVEGIARSTSIGSDKAELFAFADAGVDPVAARNVHTEFDFENGHFVYEVEFTANGTEYEYWVLASNGAIERRKTESAEEADPSAAVKKGSASGTPVTAGENREEGFIGADKAKSVALADAGLTEADVTFIEAKFDYDDGVRVYDVEFFSAEREYDYEIDAATGAIREKSVEPLKGAAGNTRGTAASQGTEDGFIGAEKAKAAALADAGLTEAEVTFTKAKLDRDDGVRVYDVEFFSAEREYDYEIDAATGAIREKSVESLKGTAGNQAAASQGTEAGFIGVDKAKSIALEHVNLTEAEVTFTKAKLDREKGRTVYEIEFIAGGTEYEYDIDATTGAILDVEIDNH